MSARQFTAGCVVGALCLMLAAAAWADGNTEATGVQSKTAPPSPAGGSSQPGGISNVDDYTQQQDQIQIKGDANGVIKVLRANQKNLVNDFVVRTFPINRAVPMEVRQVFREITAQEGGRAELIVDAEKKQNYLWVTAPKFQMPYIEAAVKELDEPWVKDNVDGSLKIYYQSKFRGIASIAAIVKTPTVAAIGTADDNLIVLDEINNAALIEGEPFRVGLWKKFAPAVDQPVPQVLLEAAVYEVEVSKELRLGLDYIAWKNGPGRNLFDFVYWGSSYSQNPTNKTSVLDPFVAPRTTANDTLNGDASGWYSSFNYLLTSAFMDFLEGVGRARMVTRGKVLIKNGQLGTLSATDQVLYFQTTPSDSAVVVPALPGAPTTTTPANPTPVNGIVPSTVSFGTPPTSTTIPIWNREVDKDQKIEIGFSMSVLPYVGEETTQLALVMSLNDIVGQTPSGTPQVRTNSLATTVLVKDGKQICVGGLRRTEDARQTAKMPILGSIPVLGWLFGHESTVKRETELVVVLTPLIRLGTEADLEMANDEDRLIRAQVERRAKLTLPKTEVGFDQWLLNSDR